MKLRSIYYVAILLLLTFAGCNNDKKIVIAGEYNNREVKHLYVTRVDVDIPVFIDSVKVSKSGTFSVKIEYDQPAFYNLGSGNNDFITVIAYPGDKINLTFEGKHLNDGYSVEGSRESEDIRQLDIELAKTLSTLDSLTKIFETLEDNDVNQAQRAELEKRYTEVIKAQRMHNIGYIIENLSSFSSIKALYQRLNENAYVLYQPRDAQYLKLVSDTLNAHYPGSKQARALAQNLKNELNALDLNRITGMASGAKTNDLDLNLADYNGKRVALSSLKGKKYVLLTFWSAQSKECITNNLQLKEYYSRYRSRGFEIYQVNIDTDENIWKQSVRFDELPWISVREDDPANPLSVVKYNVTKVPANYLIDMDGEIIGKDLYGKSLQIKLSQLFD